MRPLKQILSALFMATTSITLAQSVNGIPLKEITSEYVQIIGTPKALSHKLTIELDFGQLNKVFNAKDTQVVDTDGKRIEWNSMVDALNFMSANGYEFVQAYTFNVSQENVFHFLMRRKVDRG